MSHAAAQSTTPPPAAAREITPGTYLRMRREAARMTLREAALCYAHTTAGASSAELLLADAEADRAILSAGSLVRLGYAFAFDGEIYQDLVEGLPTPSLCRVCACSWNLPCEEADHGPCAWTDQSETLCTACARKMPEAQA